MSTPEICVNEIQESTLIVVIWLVDVHLDVNLLPSIINVNLHFSAILDRELADSGFQ